MAGFVAGTFYFFVESEAPTVLFLLEKTAQTYSMRDILFVVVVCGLFWIACFETCPVFYHLSGARPHRKVIETPMHRVRNPCATHHKELLEELR